MSEGDGRNRLCEYEYEMSILSQLEGAEKTIEALQQENEQLKVQVSRMKHALKLAESRFKVIEQATDYIKPNKGVWHTAGIALQEIHQALSDTPTDYHNPADVEALEKAREALESIQRAVTPVSNACDDVVYRLADEALVAIDKIGGVEDV